MLDLKIARRSIYPIVTICAAAAILFVFVVPVIPQGGYALHYPDSRSTPEYRLPHSVFAQTVCAHTLCPIASLYGQSYVSISYSGFGIGGYMFIEAHQLYIWSFIT